MNEQDYFMSNIQRILGVCNEPPEPSLRLEILSEINSLTRLLQFVAGTIGRSENSVIKTKLFEIDEHYKEFKSLLHYYGVRI